MSALPSKADIAERDCHVRFVTKSGDQPANVNGSTLSLMRLRTDKWRRCEFVKYGYQFGVRGRAAFANGLDRICFCQSIEVDEEANTSAPGELCLG